ncbi:MAG: hypothetical protein Q9207_002806 [Kuettlingeria erythrocarpa]
MSDMTKKELKERIWDLEEQLDDTKATNQSQAAQIEVHLAQIRRLRGELRAKERERHTIEAQSATADLVPKIEPKDVKKTEEEDIKKCERKNVKGSEQAVKIEELGRGLTIFHEADDIREHIIEVKSSSSQTIRGLNRFGHAGSGGFERHASDDVSTQVKKLPSAISVPALLTLPQQLQAHPFHYNYHSSPYPRAAGIGQATDFSTTTPPPAPTFRRRTLHAAPVVHPAGNSAGNARQLIHPIPVTEGLHGASYHYHQRRRSRQERRRRQEPPGILIGTVRLWGSNVGRSNAVYGSQDRHGRVTRRISNEDQHGRIVSGQRLRVTLCQHSDVDYLGPFSNTSKADIDNKILQLLADASTPTFPASDATNPSVSTVITRSLPIRVKLEVQGDDDVHQGRFK